MPTRYLVLDCFTASIGGVLVTFHLGKVLDVKFYGAALAELAADPMIGPKLQAL